MGCLHYIFDKELVVNSDFPVWVNRHKMQAERECEIQKMKAKDLKSI